MVAQTTSFVFEHKRKTAIHEAFLTVNDFSLPLLFFLFFLNKDKKCIWGKLI